MESLETLEDRQTDQAPSERNDQRGARWRRFGIALFGLTVFLFFLIMKLPEARIQNLVIAHLRIMSQQQGFLFSAEKVRVGILLGPSLKLYNVELKSVDDDKQVLKIPHLKIRPQLLSLVTTTKKVGFSAELLDGELSGTTGAGSTTFHLDVDIDALNLSATTLLRRYVPIELSGKVSGRLKLDLDSSDPKKGEGAIKLNLDKLLMPAQNVMGFSLPKIGVAASKVDVAIEQGKIVLRTVEIGKDIKTDDFVATLAGDGVLDRSIIRSRMNLKAVFSLSQSVMQNLQLLDSLLAPAKTSNGKFTFQLSGPLMSLEARPGG